MAQPSIPGTGIGKPVMPYGSDGSDWIALLVSGLGALQVELASLPTGAVTIADGADVMLGALADAVVAAGAVGSVSAKLRRLTTDLDALLTELKLKADLTEIQPVESKSGDKLFGFESIVEQALLDEDVAAAFDAIGGTPVDSDKIWKITQASIKYIGTGCTKLAISVFGLAGGMVLLTQDSPTSDRWYSWTGEVYLQDGDYIEVMEWEATAGNDLHGTYAGVQMNVP